LKTMESEFNTIAVLTSGGDAQGMNPAVRAIVRTSIKKDLKVYAIHEGYRGMIRGGDFIKEMKWGDVGGILQKGGTVIGSARSHSFRSLEGRKEAAFNLIEKGIQGLVIVGGDGSLTGANLLRGEWQDHLDALKHENRISDEQFANHSKLRLVGLVGSIDNDMIGTDITIGADSALHRITEAIDAISSTAASHQRSFVVEVMGRNSGYLALMSAMATGADWVLLPEAPPNIENWEDRMCDLLKAGRETGRRDSIVIVAEGARDKFGNPISAQYVQKVLEERLNEDTRVTILGHVQRGGAPSAFDRYLSTLQGYHAIECIMSEEADKPQVIGIKENRIIHVPLEECLSKTNQLASLIKEQRFEEAMVIRGSGFKEAFDTIRTLVRPSPRPPEPGQKRMRIAIMHCGGPAAGMNTAAKTATRLALDKGHFVFGVKNGFKGLINGDLTEMNWMSVNGWTSRGGAELGTNRKLPEKSDYYKIARVLEEKNIDAILMIGGMSGYISIHQLYSERDHFPAFNIPMVCLPASINNNLPGSELSIGSDTALNNIVEVVDKIKQSAVASKRCFVVEVMGRYCGYLALMSGLSTGAERVYLHEEGVTLKDLQNDLEMLLSGFKNNKRLGLVIRNENANQLYTTSFTAALFEEEGGDFFDVRQAILGHLQQGGDPSPYDRTQGARYAKRCIEYLVDEENEDEAAFMGIQGGHIKFFPIDQFKKMIDKKAYRPKKQWWLKLREVARIMTENKD
jgi:6-phosphofructokinase 1